VSAAHNNNIIIHEAARPFVTLQEFKALIDTEADYVTYGLDIPFTVSVREHDTISGLLERDKLVNIQLPQKLQRDTLLTAYKQAEREGLTFTEDTSLLYHYMKIPIKILEGTPHNIKITDYVDLVTGEMIYKEYIIGRA
jgi:2-C-methyl-D-erythritol 4-phosphate cytidylyltransferase